MLPHSGRVTNASLYPGFQTHRAVRTKLSPPAPHHLRSTWEAFITAFYELHSTVRPLSSSASSTFPILRSQPLISKILSKQSTPDLHPAFPPPGYFPRIPCSWHWISPLRTGISHSGLCLLRRASSAQQSSPTLEVPSLLQDPRLWGQEVAVNLLVGCVIVWGVKRSQDPSPLGHVNRVLGRHRLSHLLPSHFLCLRLMQRASKMTPYAKEFSFQVALSTCLSLDPGAQRELVRSSCPLTSAHTSVCIYLPT